MKKSAGKNQINWMAFEEVFKKHGYSDYKWIHPKDIVSMFFMIIPRK